MINYFKVLIIYFLISHNYLLSLTEEVLILLRNVVAYIINFYKKKLSFSWNFISLNLYGHE